MIYLSAQMWRTAERRAKEVAMCRPLTHATAPNLDALLGYVGPANGRPPFTTAGKWVP
jgi:hypothetical protein